MTTKQFFNNVVCAAIDKIKTLQKFIKLATLVLYPDFPLIPRLRIFGSVNKLIEILKLYLLLLFILFIVPGIWSALNGQFLPDKNPKTTTFIEDKENLWNYLLICQLYVIIGFKFLKNNENLDNDLKASGLYDKLNLTNIQTYQKSKYGFIGLIILFLVTLYFSAGYAYELTYYSSKQYWFMTAGPPSISYSKLGFYYFFLNFILLFIVILVGLSFLGFVKKIGYISSKLEIALEKTKQELESEGWRNEDEVRKWLSPISIQTFLMQLFVFILALNLVLWNIDKQGIGHNYQVSVIVLFLFGLWLFTLPRYYVNYKVFKIWKILGRLEYKNLNLPWLIGATGFIDLILFTFLLKYLIGDSWLRLVDKILGT